MRNQTSLYNFVHGTQSIVEIESRWIREGADLAAVAHEEEQGWFNGFLEDTLRKISPWATQVSNHVPLVDIVSVDSNLDIGKKLSKHQ